MTTRIRRGGALSRARRSVAVLTTALAIGAASIGGQAPAGAEDPPPPPIHEGGHTLTPLPGYEEYAGCPLLNAGSIRLCIAATVSGDLQLGKVSGVVEGLKMVMAVQSSGSASDPAVIVPSQSAAAPADVPVPGGILGLPALDPILELDPLDLLTLSASPQTGPLMQTGIDSLLLQSFVALAAAGWPNQANTTPDAPVPMPAVGEDYCFIIEGENFCLGLGGIPALNLGLPLTLKLNNTLLGPDCKIGPIDLQVTSGTTTPPAGVAPMTGSSGVLTRNIMGNVSSPDFHIDDIGLVGNSFAIPGSDCGGILNTGRLLGGLLGPKANPFNLLVNTAAGLPSAAGKNVANLSLDLHVTTQEKVYGPPFTWSEPGPVSFGNQVRNTTSAPKTLTITNTRNAPRTFTVRFQGANAGFALANNQCVSLVMAAGESCSLDVTFTPTSTGVKTTRLEVVVPGEPISSVHRLTLTGTGTL